MQPRAGNEAAAFWLGFRSSWSDAWDSLPIEIRSREPGQVLIELENRFLDHLLKLQAIESQLWRAASRLRGRAGRRAVRMIERERQRLGRELHTGVGQLLAAIRLQLEVAGTHLPNASPPVQQALARIDALAAEALDQVRSVSRRLHPPEWQRLRIEDALRQLWETSGMTELFAGTVDAPPLDFDPDPEVKTLIYRATQEAISNIARHAKASRVYLALSCVKGKLRLAVHDDGVGFDPDRALAGKPSITSGIGLRSIREQAADLGGKLLVRSGPLGTTLEVFVPLLNA